MRQFFYCTLILLTSGSVVAHETADEESAPYDQLPIFGATDDEKFACSEGIAITRLDENKCLSKQIEELERALNTLVERIAESMRISAEEIDNGWGPEGSLWQSHAAWKTFRQANCELYYVAAYGGTIRTSFGLACALRMTKTRLKEMEHLAILEGINEGY